MKPKCDAYDKSTSSHALSLSLYHSASLSASLTDCKNVLFCLGCCYNCNYYIINICSFFILLVTLLVRILIGLYTSKHFYECKHPVRALQPAASSTQTKTKRSAWYLFTIHCNCFPLLYFMLIIQYYSLLYVCVCVCSILYSGGSIDKNYAPNSREHSFSYFGFFQLSSVAF